MQFRVLGPLEVVAGGDPVAVGPPRQQALLATLLMLRNQVVSTDRVVDALWGERPPPSAGSTLQAYVSRLRRSLASGGADTGTLETRRPGYVLHVPDTAVDAGRFERLVTDGRARLEAGDPAEAADLLATALGLWRGPALAGLAEQGLLAAEATRLEESRLNALEDRLQADLDLGRHADIVGELESLVAEHPFRERLWGHLMLAHYRAGRQADALDSYRRAASTLRDELGLDPSENLHALHERILRHDSTLASDTPSAVPPPQANRFRLPARREAPIGRDADLEAVVALLDRSRLVTLTGAGGSGKTTLALAAGRAVEGRFTDGAVLVELARVDDVRDVCAAVLMALDSHRRHTGAEDPAAAAVADVLRDREVLLVLDGCEHVVEEAARLADVVLTAGPDVRVLATSQRALEVAGEHRWPVAPLALPAESDTPSEILRTPAVVLFVHRAQAVDPRFHVSEDQVGDVARIVRELDGIPLAIELAAARAASTRLEDVTAHLGDRFRLLRGGPRTASDRQRTLEATIAWSENLLDERERRVMTRLSALPGGATVSTARQVAFDDGTDDLAALDVLERLVTKSMLMSDLLAGSRRYRMLESIRAYFVRRLGEGEQRDDVRSRLASCLLELARAAGTSLRGPGGSDAVARFDAEMANLPVVRSWALDGGDPALLFELVCAVPLVAEWWVRPTLDEVMETAARAAEDLDHEAWPAVAAATAATLAVRGRPDRAQRQLEVAVERLEPGHPLRPIALQFQVHVALMTGETDAGIAAARACLEEASAAGDRWMVAFARASLALVLAIAGSGDEATGSLADLESAMADVDSPVLAAWCAYVRGEVLGDGAPQEAIRHYQAAVDLARRTGADALLGVALIGQSSVQARHGEPVDALAVFAEALDHHLGGSRWQMCWSALLNLVQPLSRLDEHAAVLEILGAAATSDTCPPIYGGTAERVGEVEERAVRALGESAASAARDRGGGLTDPAVVRAALRTIAKLRALHTDA